MTLHILGINHNDPAMRQSLTGWLSRKAGMLGRPHFVGVEWDHALFDRVTAQRQRFRELVAFQWPAMSDSLLNILSLSLGYEGDSHIEVFGQNPVETLWLDEGREYYEGDITQFPENRLALYTSYLPQWPERATDAQIILLMSESASKDVGDPPLRGDLRDGRFADLLTRRFALGAEGWAVAIVGKFHATKIDGSMLAILESRNIVCEVSML